MDVKSILMKLAEKEAIGGNQDFAYNLVVMAEKSGKCSCGKKCPGKYCSECSKMAKCSYKGCQVKKTLGDMIKSGDKSYCCDKCKTSDSHKKSALSDMILKYAQDYNMDQPSTDMSGSGMGNMSGDPSMSAAPAQSMNPYANDPMRGPIWQEGFDAGSNQNMNSSSDPGMSSV